MISIGDEIWVEYDEPGPRLVHKRLVVGVAASNPEHFGVLSPDFDVYVEECDNANADIRNWWKDWPAGAPAFVDVVPPGVRQYTFAVYPTVAEIAQACAVAAGKLLVHDRLAGGGGAAAPGGHGLGAPPGHVVVPAAAPGPLGGGVAAGIPAAMAAGAAGAPPPAAAGAPGAAPPAGLGGLAGLAALVAGPGPGAAPAPLGAGPAAAAAAPPAGGGDLRTIATAYDTLGQRHREFRDSVQLMRPTAFPDCPVLGPSTYHWVANYQVENGGSPLGHHLAWKGALGASVSPDDPIVTMHYEFSKIMQVAQSYDQLDGSNLASLELVARQLQLCEERCKDKLVSARGSGAGGDEQFFFTGMQSTRGIMVAPALSEWIAKQLSAESAIAKERRKAREERQLVHPPGGGGGGGGRGGGRGPKAGQ